MVQLQRHLFIETARGLFFQQLAEGVLLCICTICSECSEAGPGPCRTDIAVNTIGPGRIKVVSDDHIDCDRALRQKDIKK